MDTYQILAPLKNDTKKKVYFALKDFKHYRVSEYYHVKDAEKDLKISQYVNQKYFPHFEDRFTLNECSVLVQPFSKGLSGEDLYTIPFDDKMTFARNLIDALKSLHEQQVLSNNLTLDKIYYTNSHQVLIYDFSSFISLHSYETLSLASMPIVNPYYTSPEVIAKLPGNIDYKSDYYQLGITLYLLFTGVYPFHSDDISELLSSHLSKTPIFPHTLNSELSPNLSLIILKLLSKERSERYACLDGLLYDLSHIHDNDFEIAKGDIPHHLSISAKLYGREKEISAIHEHIVRQEISLITIEGHSGTGKSSLMERVFQEYESGRHLVLRGKFQQYKRDTPYLGFIQAINNYVENLFFADETILNSFRDDFQHIFNDLGGVLTEIFPQLQSVLPLQNKVLQLNAHENEHRFCYLFLQFLEMLARRENHLMLFLDDVQWIDLSSLAILSTILLSDKIGISIILAFRDNEITSLHPLAQFLQSPYKMNVPFLSVKLHDLTLNDIELLIADTLHNHNHDLSQVLFHKTHGNAFFLHQFFATTIEYGYFRYDVKYHYWIPDLEAINSIDITNNVLFFLQQRLSELPENVLNIIKLIGVIGHTVSLDILSTLSSYPICELSTLLEIPIKFGLIRFDSNRIYFTHDKVEEAAYQLNSSEILSRLHYDIARMLMAYTNMLPSIDIFDITSHLTKGFDQIENNWEEYCSFFLNAALKSKSLSSYGDYLTFANHSLQLSLKISNDTLRLASQREYHIALHLNAQYEEAGRFFDENLRDRKEIFELKENYVTKINQDSILGNYTDSTQFALFILKKVGISITFNPSFQELVENRAKIREAFQMHSIKSVYDLKKISCRDQQRIEFICDIFAVMLPPTFYSSPMSVSLVIFKTIELAIENGIYESMAYLFSSAMIPFVMIENDYRTPYDYTKFAMEISANNKRALGNSKHLFFIFSYHWVDLIKDETAIEMMRDAFQLLREGGDVANAGYTFFSTIGYRFERGDSLTLLHEEIENGIHYASLTHNIHAIGTYRVYEQLQLFLQSENNNFEFWSENGFDENRYLIENSQNNMALNYYYIYKTQLLYLFGNLDQAWEHSRKAKVILPYIMGFLPVSTHYFYTALLLCERIKSDITQMNELNDYLAQLQIWGEMAPHNWKHKHSLVIAEKAYALGDIAEAIRYFSLALKEAKHNHFIHDIALCYERSAYFWFALSNNELGEFHLQQAYHYYQQWGATKKLSHLRQSYESCFLKEKIFDLNLLSFVKMQHILAEETNIETLLIKTMSILLEISGAEKGLLFLENNGWSIHSSLNVEETGGEIAFPHDLLNYTIRTQKGFDLDDTEVTLNDPYLRTYKPRSLIFMPVIHQSKLIAIIYLEHSKIERIFTNEKKEYITLLSSQIAISLQNAFVYNDLERLIAQRTDELKEKNQELEHLTITDYLTQIYNRKKLDEYFESEIIRSARTTDSFAIILLDIDYFKRINDTYGHLVGDQVLVDFAAIMSQNIRKSDIVGRWGGEEFLILCPSSTENGAYELAEKLRLTIAEYHFSIDEPLTASLGVTSYSKGDTKEKMTSRADEALYRAKAAGRNCVNIVRN